MTTTPADFIKLLTVSQLSYPLYDHIANPAKCYYGLGAQSVWDGVPTPTAAPEDSTFVVTLSDTGVTKIPTLTPPYSLSAKLGAMEVFKKAIFPNPILNKLEGITLQTPTVNAIPGGAPKMLPWRFSGSIDWVLEGSRPDQPRYTCKTNIELYVLPTGLPQFFDTTGIPLALLRDGRYLPAWMNDAETDWAKFAVKAMFSDDRLEYETYGGSSKYVSWSEEFRKLFTNNGGIDCWLDLWLSDLEGVKLKKAKHTVNCYDLAALCQAVVSLGMDSKSRLMRMKYMDPYGYINETHLIGRIQDPPDPIHNPDNLCNNPFYDRDSTKPKNGPMLCGIDDVTRSAFGNHMFLTISTGNDDRVFDACCGPQLGDLTIHDYTIKAIDSRAVRYGPKLNHEDYELGGVGDITDGVGISQLVTSRCFEKPGDPNSPGESLLDQLAEEFKGDGDWYQPYISTPQGNWNMTATWTFTPRKNASEIITINVFAYDDEEDPVWEYKRRKRAVPGWIQNKAFGDNEAENDTGVDGSSRMFYNDSDSVYPWYLCTIDSRIGNAASTKGYRSRIQKVLDTCLDKNRTTLHPLEKVTVNPVDPALVGSYITLSANVSIFLTRLRGLEA